MGNSIRPSRQSLKNFSASELLMLVIIAARMTETRAVPIGHVIREDNGFRHFLA